MKRGGVWVVGKRLLTESGSLSFSNSSNNHHQQQQLVLMVIDKCATLNDMYDIFYEVCEGLMCGKLVV
jgi:hypothetical protein